MLTKEINKIIKESFKNFDSLTKDTKVVVMPWCSENKPKVTINGLLKNIKEDPESNIEKELNKLIQIKEDVIFHKCDTPDFIDKINRRIFILRDLINA